jgi:glycosyltransferase involved in cell wall biosynthesis
MSQANLNYVLEQNPEIITNKVEVNPNSLEIIENIYIPRESVFKKYKIPEDKIIFIFGGNLGAPQGVDLLMKHITYCKSINEAFFLIVGNGTEFNKFKVWIEAEDVNNAVLIRELPKLEYDEIISFSHVGLIFLNPNFTIPNFPSRILSYMQHGLPVICATDLVTDIGEIASENKFGYKCFTTDFQSFFDFVVKLLNKDLRTKMGKNGYQFLLNEYNVENSYNIIMNKITI